MRELKPTTIKSQKRKPDYWDSKSTQVTVFVLEIEHDENCDTDALAVMFEGGAQGNIKKITVVSHD